VRGAGPAGRDGTPVAPDAIALLRALRGEWAVRRGLDPAALHATAVRADVWAAAEAATRADGTCLVAHLDDPAADPLELPVRRTVAGDVATALHERGITVLLAPDDEALARALGRHLTASGFAQLPDAVEVRARAVPRPERLDPSVISTPYGGPIGPHERQEAHA
jgi:hypothetical protein